MSTEIESNIISCLSLVVREMSDSSDCDCKNNILKIDT